LSGTYRPIRSTGRGCAKLFLGRKPSGIHNFWIPPACKSAGGGKANGYDIYDLYHIGEFDQMGSKATKWGTKEERMDLSKDAKKVGVELYFDCVLNHKAGADNKEKCKVIKVDNNARTKDIGEEHEIEAWLGLIERANTANRNITGNTSLAPTTTLEMIRRVSSA
jgi:hypothetical protein